MREMKNKVAYGRSFLKDANVRVNSFNHDQFKQTVKISFEKGIDVNTMELTVEFLEEIGFLNFSALDKLVQNWINEK